MSHKLKKWAAKKTNNERNKKLEDNKKQQQKNWNTTKNAQRKNFFAEQKSY